MDKEELRPVTNYWPAWSKEAAKLVGHDVVAKIMEHLGGTEIYIPQYRVRGSALSRIIGIEATMALAEEFGGLTINVPKGDIAKITARNRIIAQERQAGETTVALALKYRLTERQVRNIYRKTGVE